MDPKIFPMQKLEFREGIIPAFPVHETAVFPAVSVSPRLLRCFEGLFKVSWWKCFFFLFLFFFFNFCVCVSCFHSQFVVLIRRYTVWSVSSFAWAAPLLPSPFRSAHLIIVSFWKLSCPFVWLLLFSLQDVVAVAQRSFPAFTGFSYTGRATNCRLYCLFFNGNELKEPHSKCPHLSCSVSLGGRFNVVSLHVACSVVLCTFLCWLLWPVCAQSNNISNGKHHSLWNCVL